MIDPGFDPKPPPSNPSGGHRRLEFVTIVAFNDSKPRYYVDSDEHHYFWLDSEFSTGRHDLRDYGLKKIFVNILKKEKRYYHIKLFLKDGQTQEAYLPTYYDDAIRIYGMDMLFDGRFNI